ncbi:osteopontin isoform X2 [Xiphias gladius]|uniref:osteopontin isoform X2 n=1 Tax=Xiphias gladius TaxID=8245 RepID=UPI001A99F11A|nr:osteopontin isoform X2 [Xiphias gladius]
MRPVSYILSHPSLFYRCNISYTVTPNCDTMKVAVVFILLFATVLCRPARKVSDSSSESSEEVVKQSEVPAIKTQEGEASVQAAAEVTSDSADPASTSTPDTVTVTSDSEDSDDSDDDEDESEESESEEEDEDDESSDNSESGEASTPAPTTVSPVVVTEESVSETTAGPIVPTIVTDEETARGDNLGGYPSDYKSIVYVEDKSYHKIPAPYKSYEFIITGKKMAVDMIDGNEVEKSPKVYKALQVHSDILEEDTSTPEMENQGLDASSGTSHDQDLSPRQASLPEEQESASTGEVSTSDTTSSDSESSSAPQEEEEEDQSASTTSASASASTSQESEDEESQSSEEATATPGASDSDSDESDSSESDSDEGAGPDTTTDIPVVITAK